MTSSPIRLLLVLLICAAPAACGGGDQRMADAKVREIEEVWRTMPIHPGMAEVDRSSSASGGQALVSRKYRSDAHFDDVRGFYAEQLADQGWRLVDEREVKDRGRLRGERQVEFRRGEFYLDIRYAGARGDELGWTYAVDVEWYE